MIRRRETAAVGFLIFLVTLTSPDMLGAYDLDTHRALARDAYARGEVAARLSNYGLDPEARIRGRLVGVRQGPLPPIEWVAWGARDEDVPLSRVLNHFYDPAKDRGLTLPGFAGTRAPDWALEDQTVDLPGQSHSYRDAREGFYGGLTLPDLAARERELGFTLYALGHVIHLIQDLTVPEHARNDPHFPLGPGKSFLEGYLEHNIRQFTPTAKLSVTNLPNPGTPRDLWSMGVGTGIAQFTNAHFVSPDTNFSELRNGATGGEYPSPVLDLGLRETGPPGPCRDPEQPLLPPGSLVFYGNIMPDPVGSAFLQNRRMTTRSLFDAYLQNRGKKLLFSVNCYTVDAAAEILLPRAVSYSASLLEYFFRGRMTAIFGGNTFRIVNRTHDARRAEAMSGRFELYGDAAAGRRQLLGAWSLDLGPDRMSGPLAVPALADGAYARCILVFRGRLGEEGDGVAGQQLAGCPTATTLAGPFIEVGLLAGSGGGVSAGSPGCPGDGYWLYILEICCFPGSPPHYGYYCKESPQAALIACQSSTTGSFLTCRLPS